MSVRIMTAVWGVPLPDSEKIVLLALADCANDEGECWPSMATLAKKCSKSDRTVQAAIKSLVSSGHLTRIEVMGRGCRYTVHPRSDFTPEAISPPKGTTETPEAASDKPSGTITSSETKVSSEKRARPSRIPNEWEPGPLPENVASLVAQWPPGRERRELDGFRDFWSAASKNAAKLDWDKTWWNRIRDQHDRIIRGIRNEAHRGHSGTGGGAGGKRRDAWQSVLGQVANGTPDYGDADDYRGSESLGRLGQSPAGS